MENNIEFALAIDTLNKKIAELNIKISKDLSNVVLKHELQRLLQDRDKLFKSVDKNELETLIKKYGSKDNG